MQGTQEETMITRSWFRFDGSLYHKCETSPPDDISTSRGQCKGGKHISCLSLLVSLTPMQVENIVRTNTFRVPEAKFNA